MSDLLFLLLVLAGFAVLRLAVAGLDRLVGHAESPEERRVSVGDVVGLVLAVAVLGYLVVALLFPERLG